MWRKQQMAVFLSGVVLLSCSGNEVRTVASFHYDKVRLDEFVRASAVRPKAASLKSLDSLLAGVSADSLAFREAVGYLAGIYSDPNSPLRDEGLFDRLLKAELNSEWYTPDDKKGAAGRLYLLHQNDVGTPANDFQYVTPEGETRRLYELNALYTILFFYNPDCEACRAMKDALMASRILKKASSAGRVAVFCMYTDPDLHTWYSHLSEFPEQWIQGRDSSGYLFRNNVFDLHAIPSIYLLDRRKRVVLKDCTSIDKLEQRIE